MAIAIRGSATSATNANVGANGSLSCAKPTGVITGDVMLAQVTRNDDTLTAQSGWVLIDDTVGGTAGTDHFMTGWWYKVAGGSEPSTYSWTKTAAGGGSPVVITIVAYSGVDNTSPIGGSSAHGYTSQGEPLSTGTCTSSGTSLTIWGRGARRSTTSNSIITFTATGATELKDVGIWSGGSVAYSHVMYAATAEATGNASALGITASPTTADTNNTTMVLTLVEPAPVLDASADSAGATGTANAPTIELDPSASSASSTGSAADAVGSTGAAANAGAGSTTAYDATVSFSNQATPDVATEAVAAYDATVATTFTVDVATTATSAAFDAGGVPGVNASAALATASTSAADGTVTLTSSPTASVATASTTSNAATNTLTSSPTADVATASTASQDASGQAQVAIAYFGSGTGFVAGGNTLNVSTPASIPAGAVIVLCAGGFCASATPTPSGTGWTLVDTQATGSARFWTWVKVAAGGEGTITVTMDGNALFGGGGCSVYTGVDTSNPVVAHNAAVWAGVDHSSLTSPSVNNTGIGTECAVFTGAFYNGATGHGQTTPTNMTQAFEAGDSNEASTFTYYRLNAPTGSQSYSTSTTGGQSDWYGGDGLLFLKQQSGVSVNSGASAATTAAQDATTSLTSSPSADVAQPTASALDAVALVSTVTGVATEAIQAYDATVLVGPAANVAQASSTGQDASTFSDASATAGAPNGTAAGQDATASLASSPGADSGSSTATAYDVVALVSSNGEASPTTADAQGAALDATADVQVLSGSSPTTADAHDATVATVEVADAPAEVAPATATALDASVGITFSALGASSHAGALDTAPPAEVHVFAADAIPGLGSSADTSGSTATAYDAFPGIDAQVFAGVATAAASGQQSATSGSACFALADTATAQVTAYGALGFGFIVTATDNYTYSVPSESRTETIERESRVYTPRGDWNDADAILA